MSTLSDYFAFAQKRPDLFVNPPGGSFEILLNEDEIHQVEAEMVTRLQAQGYLAEWATVGIVYRDQYIMLLRDAVRFPNGATGTYIRMVDDVDSVPGVIVLPYYRENILLIRHFRHATRTWHLEIPRGFGAKGFSSEENALRELLEEIGASAIRLVSLGWAYPDAGASTERDEFFLAYVDSYGNGEVEEGISEIITTPLATFESLIKDGGITDSFTLTAYALAKAKGLL